MENKLSKLINLAKHLPEQCLDQAIESLEKMKDEGEKEERQKVPDCPHCGGKSVVRNGRRRGKQQYLCRECGKSFVRTIGMALYNSHSGEAVWRQVIRDTVKGISLDETVVNLYMHHGTVFNMRHKVLEPVQCAFFAGVSKAYSVFREGNSDQPSFRLSPIFYTVLLTLPNVYETV
ncbi:MAG: hypothetical protein LBI85_05235 [Spirochaetaceae bacterium]|jgi:transposase-like protein|nr:hypothetical protein [Spirochaetaceae bacterium]